MKHNVFVTGGAGFIGSHFVRRLLMDPDVTVTVYDDMTYAGNMKNLADLDQNGLLFVRGDVCDARRLTRVIKSGRYTHAAHFAAESHVDSSIENPGAFVQTNITGTYNLLEALLHAGWCGTEKKLLHVSTDEVYGSLGPDDPAFTEVNRCDPSSPYSASKAASDHLVRAYQKTYGLPAVVAHCSNNYGPMQHPEKLIPKMIRACLEERPLTVHGDGLAVRDWLHVTDCVEALRWILQAVSARPGETFNVGGGNERTNLQVVQAVCGIMDRLRPRGEPYGHLIRHVEDRPGQDARYAVNTSFLQACSGWLPVVPFDTGLAGTVMWNLDNKDWWGP